MKQVTLKNITLLNCDSLDYLRTCEDKHFDLAIIDPPYWNQADNRPNYWMRIKDGRDTRIGKAMQSFGDRPTKAFFEELARVCKEWIIWGANNFQLPPYKGFIVWKKKTISEATSWSMAEIAAISEGLGKTSKVVELMPRCKGKIHPTQKPVELYQWLLSRYAKEGMKIIDTHSGSGTLAIAADGMFDVTLCEIDPVYFDRSKERIIQHQQLNNSTPKRLNK